VCVRFPNQYQLCHFLPFCHFIRHRGRNLNVAYHFLFLSCIQSTVDLIFHFMPLVVICPSCKTRLTLGDARAGTSFECPRCDVMIAVPVTISPPLPVPTSSPISSTGDSTVRAPRRRRRKKYDDDEPPSRRNEASHGGSAFMTMFGGSLGCAAAYALVFLVSISLCITLPFLASACHKSTPTYYDERPAPHHK
jgi:hypothetical protein